MMTREEAINALKEIKDRAWGWHINEQVLGIDYDKFIEIMDAVLSFLDLVSRERVEKVWRCEWNSINPAVLKTGVSWVCRCAKCGCPQDYKHNFCPNCGAAQTDEAVQMVMERLEEMRNG